MKIYNLLKQYTEYRKLGYPDSVPKFLEWVEGLPNKIYAWRTEASVYKLQRQNNDKYVWVGLEDSKQIWGGYEYDTISEALNAHVGSGISELKEFRNYDNFWEWANQKKLELIEISVNGKSKMITKELAKQLGLLT